MFGLFVNAAPYFLDPEINDRQYCPNLDDLCGI